MSIDYDGDDIADVNDIDDDGDFIQMFRLLFAINY